MEEVTNITPEAPSFKRVLFSGENRSHVHAIRHESESVCRFEISPQYIRTSLNTFKRGYLYYSNQDEIIGFALWKEKQEKVYEMRKQSKTVRYMELLLICVGNEWKGFGSTILADCEEYGKENDIKYLVLFPANEELVPFYRKNGYNVVSACPLTLKMAKQLIKQPLNTRKTRRSRVIKEYFSKPLQNSFNYRNFVEYEV